MTSITEDQPPYDRAVCDGMVSSAPENWNVIVLHLERTEGAEIGALLHSLESPEGHPPVAPDEALFEATYKLDDLFARHGRRFTKATYRVELFEDSWKFHVDFNYGPPRPHPFGQPIGDA